MDNEWGPRITGEDLKRFRTNCRIRRLLMGISSRAMAKLVGHTVTWLSQMELGPTKRISMEDAKQMAKGLGTTVEILLQPAPDMVTIVTREEGLYAIEYLKKLQTEKMLNSIEFSLFLGLSKSTWKTTTHLQRPFSINTLYLIAQRLGISVGELIGREKHG